MATVVVQVLVVLLASLLASTESRHLRSLQQRHRDASSANPPSPSLHFNADMKDLQRVLVFPPTATWGQQVLQQQSLRLLVIGGSNSQSHYEYSYTTHLQKWVTGNSMFSNKRRPSYVKISSTPTDDLRIRVEQDIRNDVLGVHNSSDDTTIALASWPNVIMIEHSQDCNEDFTMNCAFLVEKLLRLLFAEYEAQQLPHPDVLLVDVLRVEKYYYLGQDWTAKEYPEHIKECNQAFKLSHGGEMSRHSKLAATTTEEPDLPSALEMQRARNHTAAFIPPGNIEYNDRGSSFGVNLVEMARFHRYPILTVKDSWYPAFVEHFLGHDLCEPWPYLDEGRYLTPLGHDTLFHLIKSFLETTLEQAVADKKTSVVKYVGSSIYNTDMQFGPLKDNTAAVRLKHASSKTILIDQDYYLPTEEEIDRAFSLSHPLASSWADNIVHSGSLRILLLGGSNTANGRYFDGMRQQLLEQRTLSYSWLEIDASYVINGGISGFGPTITKLSFEYELPPARWPNVILMEYTVNCNDEWDCVCKAKNVIRYYEALYQRHNVSAPSYVFLELFRNGLYAINAVEKPAYAYLRKVRDSCNHSQVLSERNSNTSSFLVFDETYNSRGSLLGMKLVEFARYNAVPLLSIADALFPSFVRFMDSHLTCASWPMTSDGVHLANLGVDITVRVIVDFLRRAIDKSVLHSLGPHSAEEAAAHLRHPPRSNSNNDSSNSFYQQLQAKLSLLSPSNFDNGDLLVQHRQWGQNIPYDEWMLHSIRGNQGFHNTYLQNHNDGMHECYGATETNATIELNVGAHPSYIVNYPESERSKLRFKLMLGYLHSWNTSYVGDMKCAFYALEGDDAAQKKKLLFSTVVHGNSYHHQAIQDSAPREIELTSRLGLGDHLLQCSPAQAGRLACITSIAIYRLP